MLKTFLARLHLNAKELLLYLHRQLPHCKMVGQILLKSWNCNLSVFLSAQFDFDFRVMYLF